MRLFAYCAEVPEGATIVMAIERELRGAFRDAGNSNRVDEMRKRYAEVAHELPEFDLEHLVVRDGKHGAELSSARRTSIARCASWPGCTAARGTKGVLRDRSGAEGRGGGGGRLLGADRAPSGARMKRYRFIVSRCSAERRARSVGSADAGTVKRECQPSARRRSSQSSASCVLAALLRSNA